MRGDLSILDMSVLVVANHRKTCNRVSLLVINLLRPQVRTVGDSRVNLDLMLQIGLGHYVLALCSYLVGEHRIALHTDETDRLLQPLKVAGRDQCRMGQGASLDEGALPLHAGRFASLLVRVLLRAGPSRLRHRALGRQEQYVAGAEAVPDGVDAVARGHGVGELGLAGVDDLLDQGHDLLLGVAREPHVDHEGLGRLDSLELEAVEQGGRGLGLGQGGRVGGRVAAKQVGHHDHEALVGELVGLDLVVAGVQAGAARQEQQELRGGGWIRGGLGDVGLSFVQRRVFN